MLELDRASGNKQKLIKSRITASRTDVSTLYWKIIYILQIIYPKGKKNAFSSFLICLRKQIVLTY